MKRSMYSVLMALSVSACASMTEQTMNSIIGSWKGESIDTVVAAWGIPDQKFDATETTVYEWTDSASMRLPGISAAAANVIGGAAYAGTTQPQDVDIHGVCVRQLITGKDGIVIAGGCRGDSCCVAAVSGWCASLAKVREDPRTARFPVVGASD